MIARSLAALVLAGVLVRPAAAVPIEAHLDPRGLDAVVELPGEAFRPPERFVYVIDPAERAYALDLAVGLFALIGDRRIEDFSVTLARDPAPGAPDALDLTPVLAEGQSLAVLRRRIAVGPAAPLFLAIGWDALSFAGFRIELSSDLPPAPVPLPPPAALLGGALACLAVARWARRA